MNTDKAPQRNNEADTTEACDKQDLRAVAIAIAALARTHHDESDRIVRLLDEASLLQLHSLVKRTQDIADIRALIAKPERLSDLAIVLAAMFDSESAWQRLIEELDKVRAFANKEYGHENGTVVDDAIDGTIGHLRKEAPSRDHAPSLRARLGTYRGGASLRTWLRTVAINRVKSKVKREGTNLSEIREPATAQMADAEIQHAVQEAIEQLSPADQVFARLLHVYGEAQVDIAAFLKVAPAAVSQRKNRVLKKLRDALEANENKLAGGNGGGHA